MEIGEALSIGPDIGSMQVAAGVFGTVSIATLGFLLMQIIKAFFPDLQGRWAEFAVLMVSAGFAVVVLQLAGVDWLNFDTYIAWFVGTLGLQVVMRGIYAATFKVSVPGIPPTSEAQATRVVDTGTGDVTTTRTGMPSLETQMAEATRYDVPMTTPAGPKTGDVIGTVEVAEASRSTTSTGIP